MQRHHLVNSLFAALLILPDIHAAPQARSSTSPANSTVFIGVKSVEKNGSSNSSTVVQTQSSSSLILTMLNTTIIPEATETNKRSPSTIQKRGIIRPKQLTEENFSASSADSTNPALGINSFDIRIRPKRSNEQDYSASSADSTNPALGISSFDIRIRPKRSNEQDYSASSVDSTNPALGISSFDIRIRPKRSNEQDHSASSADSTDPTFDPANVLGSFSLSFDPKHPNEPQVNILSVSPDVTCSITVENSPDEQSNENSPTRPKRSNIENLSATSADSTNPALGISSFDIRIRPKRSNTDDFNAIQAYKLLFPELS